jgi:hypothetical protein
VIETGGRRRFFDFDAPGAELGKMPVVKPSEND